MCVCVCLCVCVYVCVCVCVGGVVARRDNSRTNQNGRAFTVVNEPARLQITFNLMGHNLHMLTTQRCLQQLLPLT